MSKKITDYLQPTEDKALVQCLVDESLKQKVRKKMRKSGIKTWEQLITAAFHQFLSETKKKSASPEAL